MYVYTQHLEQLRKLEKAYFLACKNYCQACSDNIYFSRKNALFSCAVDAYLP